MGVSPAPWPVQDPASTSLGLCSAKSSHPQGQGCAGSPCPPQKLNLQLPWEPCTEGRCLSWGSSKMISSFPGTEKPNPLFKPQGRLPGVGEMAQKS